MATEKNPFEKIREEITNVVQMPTPEEMMEGAPTFEMEEDGGVTVDFTGVVEMEAEEEIQEWYGDLTDKLEDEEKENIAADVVDNYTSDKESRAEWEAMFEKGFDLLGLKIQETSEPFEGACTAVHPMLIESAVKFQSKAIQELFPPSGPVKTQILGKSTPEREDQANRVQEFMNYQTTEQMPEYFDEFERMLFHLPLIGSAFKKVYYDANLKRPVSEFVPIDQFYVSYYASNLRKADRYTHVIYRSPVDLAKDIRTGIYRDVELPEATNPQPTSFSEKMDTIIGLSPTGTNDPQYTLLEQHCYLEIEEDYALPYIVTVEEKSQQILSIRRNYKKDDKNQEKVSHFVHYRFVPGFSFYGFGLMHFLGNLTMTATAAMRSLVDAGQFANLPGGFKAKGVRIVGDNDPISPGEFKEVEATGQDLNKAIVSLPYKEPSSTLYNMLQFITQTGQKFADSTEQIVSDAASYGPVGTTMALLEASSKFFSAIHKRLHKSQRDEFKILAQINYDYLPSEYPYEVPFAEKNVLKQDFDGRIDVLPVSDPNIPSNAHRMMISQMALQMAQQSPPGMFNLEALNRTILSAANLPNLEQILPPKKEPQQLDPVSDIMAATKGIPIAAFPGQNHDAHIQTKMMYLQDPQNGANPIMQRLKPILESNIQEHSVLKYQEQMNGMTRAVMEQLPPEQAQNPQVAEMAMATAAQQVLNANQMGQAQSPEQQMVALEQAKVELEKQKLQQTAAKNTAESAIDSQKLELEEAKLLMEASKSGQSAILKKEKSDLDRASKETLKALDIMAKAALADQRADIDMEKIRVSAMEKVSQMEELDDRERSFKLIDVMSDLLKEEVRIEEQETMKGDDQNANRE
jgi:chaperonin GroES